jgi:hypothetical protein
VLRLAGLRLKTAAQEQGNVKSLEVVCLNVGVMKHRLHILDRGFFSIERHSSCSKACIAGRSSACHCSHSGHGSQACAKLIDKSTLARGTVLRRAGKLKIEITEVFAVVAGFHR